MKTKTLCCLSFLPSSFFQILLELIDAFVNPFDFFWLYLLWHQKLLYLVAPFMGKQVLKRQLPDDSVAAGLTGYFNINHLLALDATTYKSFIYQCIIELIVFFKTSCFFIIQILPHVWPSNIKLDFTSSIFFQFRRVFFFFIYE